MYKKYSVVVCLCSAMFALSGDVYAGKIQSFESLSVPSCLACDSNSGLDVSSSRYQHGKQSLRWSVGAYGFIQLNNTMPGMTVPDDINELRTGIYSDKLGGKLEILAGDPSQMDIAGGSYQKVEYLLIFTGWRSLWIKFGIDGHVVKDGFFYTLCHA